jgi:hypothetical protein
MGTKNSRQNNFQHFMLEVLCFIPSKGEMENMSGELQGLLQKLISVG